MGTVMMRRRTLDDLSRDIGVMPSITVTSPPDDQTSEEHDEQFSKTKLVFDPNHQAQNVISRQPDIESDIPLPSVHYISSSKGKRKTNEWRQGLFECFQDPKLLQNVNHFDESGCSWCLLSLCFP